LVYCGEEVRKGEGGELRQGRYDSPEQIARTLTEPDGRGGQHAKNVVGQEEEEDYWHIQPLEKTNSLQRFPRLGIQLVMVRYRLGRGTKVLGQG